MPINEAVSFLCDLSQLNGSDKGDPIMFVVSTLLTSSYRIY